MTNRHVRDLIWKITVGSFIVVEIVAALVIAIIIFYPSDEEVPVIKLLAGYGAFLALSVTIFLAIRKIRRVTDDIYG